MPRFSFEFLRDAGELKTHRVDGDFDTIDAARAEADRALRELTSDIQLGPNLKIIRVTVTDEAGRLVARRVARFEAENFDV